MIIEPKAKTLKSLLRQIRDQIEDAKAAGRRLVFRGENKDHGIITSKLYRYFMTITIQAEREKTKLEFDLGPVIKELERQLKKLGEPEEKINYGDLKGNLTERIYAQLSQGLEEDLLVEEMQESFILHDVREYIDFEKVIDTLTELQHYGGATNLIDFSRDFAVALFFACDGRLGEDGRLFLLDADAEGVISPKKNQNNRVVVQKSIFVQRKHGYIRKDEIDEIIIDKDIKKDVLTYLRHHHDIRTETIYGDLMGYIENQEMHREVYKLFFAGVMYRRAGKYEEAIDRYTKAIDLKPNFSQAFNNRGVVYYNMRKNGKAMADYDKAIELNPNFGKAYNNRGLVYARNEKYGLAIDEYDKAIERKSDYAEAYNNRSDSWKALGDYKKAREDLEAALRLAKKQDHHRLAYDTQRKLDTLRKDL